MSVCAATAPLQPQAAREPDKSRAAQTRIQAGSIAGRSNLTGVEKRVAASAGISPQRLSTTLVQNRPTTAPPRSATFASPQPGPLSQRMKTTLSGKIHSYTKQGVVPSTPTKAAAQMSGTGVVQGTPKRMKASVTGPLTAKEGQATASRSAIGAGIESATEVTTGRMDPLGGLLGR